MRKLHLVVACAVLVLAAGTRCCACSTSLGVGPLPDLPGIAAVIVPLLGLIELRRIVPHPARRRPPPPAAARLPLRGRRARPLLLRGRPRRRPPGRRQRRRRRPGARRAARGRRHAGRPARARRTPPARRTRSPPRSRSAPAARSDGRHLVGATITEIDPASRMRLMEWCYVVCSHERLRGHRPATVPAREAEAIVLPLPAAAAAPQTRSPSGEQYPWSPRRGVRVA